MANKIFRQRTFTFEQSGLLKFYSGMDSSLRGELSREISRLTNVEKRKRGGEDEAIDFSVHSPTLVVCNVTRATYLTTFASGGRAREAATAGQP